VPPNRLPENLGCLARKNARKMLALCFCQRSRLKLLFFMLAEIVCFLKYILVPLFLSTVCSQTAYFAFFAPPKKQKLTCPKIGLCLWLAFGAFFCMFWAPKMPCPKNGAALPENLPENIGGLIFSDSLQPNCFLGPKNLPKVVKKICFTNFGAKQVLPRDGPKGPPEGVPEGSPDDD
jgi:hypothetical protein